MGISATRGLDGVVLRVGGIMRSDGCESGFDLYGARLNGVYSRMMNVGWRCDCCGRCHLRFLHIWYLVHVRRKEELMDDNCLYGGR